MMLRLRSASLSPRWWPLASVTAVAPMLGCGPGSVDQGFRVTDLDFDGELTLTLTFSQPIANADAIDPNDFRISFARTFSYTYTDPETGQTSTEAYTYYGDIGGFADDGGYQGPLGFAAATLGASNNQLMLEADAAAIAPACMFLAYQEAYYEQYQYPGMSRDIGLFIHYAAGDIPLESDGGATLADIGRDWVLNAEEYSVREGYGFTRLSPQLRIPCP